MFLAPLTYTAAEKYFARTREKQHHKGEAGDEYENSDDEAGDEEGHIPNQSPRLDDTPPKPTLSQLLAKYTTRKKKKPAKKVLAHSSVFDQGSAIVELEMDRRRASPVVAARVRFSREDNDQIERLRQYVHSMPTTNEAKHEFWETMKNYQRLQMEYRASQRYNHASVIGFNMEAAWNKTVRS